MIWGRLY